MRKFLAIFLLLAGCSSSSLTFTPSPETDPVKLNFAFASLSRIIFYQKNLHSIPEFIDLTVEKEIILHPFPFEVSCDENYPLVKKFSYPTSDPAISDIEIITYITIPSPLTVLEIDGKIRYRNGEKRDFRVNEYGRERDGNILTGSIILKESIKYPENKATSSTNLSAIFIHNGDQLLPLYKTLSFTFRESRDGFITMKFNNYQQAVTMTRYSRIESPLQFTVEEDIYWSKFNLRRWKIRVTGKDFLWNELITASSEKWIWKINDGKTGSGFLDNKSAYLELFTGDEICLNLDKKCRISIHRKLSRIKIESDEISGEGRVDNSDSSVSLDMENLAGTYRVHFTGKTDASGVEIYNYIRDLTLTGMEKDEIGAGIAFTPFIYTVKWVKNWFRGRTLFLLLFHYPSFKLSEYQGEL